MLGFFRCSSPADLYISSHFTVLTGFADLPTNTNFSTHLLPVVFRLRSSPKFSDLMSAPTLCSVLQDDFTDSLWCSAELLQSMVIFSWHLGPQLWYKAKILYRMPSILRTKSLVTKLLEPWRSCDSSPAKSRKGSCLERQPNKVIKGLRT